MTAVVISQPMLFPWPGFFEQMKLAEVYLWLDDTQFSKGSFSNRIKVNVDGVGKWLTIPLMKKGSFQSINELQEASDFRSTHMMMIKTAFKGAPFAREAIQIAEEVYTNTNICDLLIASAEVPARWLSLGADQKRAKTSSLGVDGKSWQRVLDLVKSVDGTIYITGHGAAGYLDHTAFEMSGVHVEYMNYSKTAWPQKADDFNPYVSILELIAQTGPEAINYLKPMTIPWAEFTRQRIGNP